MIKNDLCQCHFDFGLPQVHSSKRRMLHFQRLSGSFHRDISTVFSFTLALQRNTLIKLKTSLRAAEVTMKLKTPRFPTKQINYLDHAMHPRRLETASHWTNPIEELKALRNITDIKILLEVCFDFWQSLKNFTSAASWLDDKPRKSSRPTLFWERKR